MNRKIKTLILAIVCLFGMLFVTGCGNKKSLNVTEFKSKMEGLGYSVVDVSEQYSNYSYVKSVTVAINSEKTVQLDFMDVENTEYAKQLFLSNKSMVESKKSSLSTESSVSIANYEKFILTTNGTYNVVSRIDNTIIYLSVSSDNQKVVDNVLKELGY